MSWPCGFRGLLAALGWFRAGLTASDPSRSPVRTVAFRFLFTLIVAECLGMGNPSLASEEPNSIDEMAHCCFGYGHWAAPYWFIGPEQGQALGENNDLARWRDAWLRCGAGELSDCREFHSQVRILKWHQEKPALQSTWRPLMLFLMTFLNRPRDNETLRTYQRSQWGSSDGETCVIELCGLPANNLKVTRDRETFRQDRIAIIQERIRQFEPRVVVMYGKSQWDDWQKIAQQHFPPDNVLKCGTTIFVRTPHPTAHGVRKCYWTDLGEVLRRIA